MGDYSMHITKIAPFPGTTQRSAWEGCFLWQGMRDSNPRKRSQSPVCYRYTNPLCGRFAYRVTSNMGIIAPKRKMSSIIFLFPRLFFSVYRVPASERKYVPKRRKNEKKLLKKGKQNGTMEM